uniref:prealbumin-like fold domain-containing protein n=1 Tax=Bifidobacterium adolescentis TaxID=1680 RepID=UPI003FEFCCB1
MALSGSLSHEGRTDAAEQFRLDRQAGKATTTAAGTFARAGGTAATHDTLHLAFPGARTLKVTSTLHYAADAAAVKADASKAKAVTVAANGDVAGPSFAPSDFGWSSWKAGRYWYDLDIPAQSGYDALAVDGLTDKAEQWTAVVPFTFDLAKLAYIGQPGQGRWSNEPVKGAVFTLTEAADASGSTAKPGTSPRTVTTDANGAAHLLDGVIGATGDRWFRLAETKAPASYTLPSADTYWMVRVSGGADKASVTVYGSNAEAKALLKGLNGSTVTVGNRLVPGAMMPMTGGRFDVARVAALAGTITLGLLIAGCWNLRRRDTDPVDR